MAYAAVTMRDKTDHRRLRKRLVLMGVAIVIALSWSRPSAAAEEYAPALGAFAFWALSGIGAASPAFAVAPKDSDPIFVDMGLGWSYAPGAVSGQLGAAGYAGTAGWFGWEGRSRFDFFGEKTHFELRQRIDTMVLLVPYRSDDEVLKLELELGVSLQPELFDRIGEEFGVEAAIGPLVGARVDSWLAAGMHALLEANLVPAVDLGSGSASYQLQLTHSLGYHFDAEGPRSGLGFRLAAIRTVPLEQSIETDNTALLLALSGKMMR